MHYGYSPSASSTAAPPSPTSLHRSGSSNFSAHTMHSPQSPRKRPQTHAYGHRTTSSLSSLAQLGINLPPPRGGGGGGPGGGGDEGHGPLPRPLEWNTAVGGTSSAGHAPQGDTFGGGGHSPYKVQRSNSILTASPSLAAGQWGAFSGPQGPPSQSPAVGREYEDVQNRTFCKWLNARLEPNGYPPVEDLGTDFSDGTRLIQLVEVLTDSSLGRYNLHPYHRVQKMENAVKALERIKEMGVHLTNIGPEDVVDGNRKLILGMIWSLVLRFSIADINEEGSHAKEGLLLWCQRKTAPYAEVDVKDFTRSWQDGLAFCALIHRHRPDLLDYDALSKLPSSASVNLAKAFSIADEHLGIPQLLDVEDICGMRRPDERSIMTYVAQFFHAFSSRAQAETEARVISKFVEEMSELMLAVHDYERRVSELLDSISAQLRSLAKNAPSPSTPYAALKALRTSLRASTARRAWMKEKVETAQLLGNVRVKLRTYGLRSYEPPEGLRVEDVAEKWSELLRIEGEQARLIEVFMRRIQEEAQGRFADQAGAAQALLARSWEEMARQAEPSQPLASQLEGFTALRLTRLAALEQAVRATRTALAACADCDAAHAGLELELEDLTVEVGLFEDALRRRLQFVENQMVARKAKAVSPEQLEEFDSAFRAFDKDGFNKLDLDQLSGALSSLGVGEVNLEDVRQDEDGLVSFEEYMRFMTERLEDRPSGNKVRSCFRSIAGEKGYVTELDLSRLQLPAPALRFLQEHMPPGEAVPSSSNDTEGSASVTTSGTAWDYEEFLNQFLE
ncbi:hypothetical protein JCM8202_002814 [Rhodotorula sphaerocarpa]